MVRIFVVFAFVAFLLTYLFAIFQAIFAPGTLLSLTAGVAFLTVAAILPTKRKLEPVPPPAGSGGARVCPVCGRPLRWVPEFSRWWCESERKYR